MKLDEATALIDEGYYGDAESGLASLIAEAGPPFRGGSGDVPELALVLRARGHALWRLARLPEAEACLVQALAIENGVERARTLDLLGGVLQYAGRWTEAEDALRGAATGLEAVLGPRDPETALAWTHQAVMRRNRLDYESSQRLLNRARGALEDRLPDDDPRLAEWLKAQSMVHWQQGESIKAIERAHEALELLVRALGAGHPASGGCFLSIASAAAIRKDRAMLREAANAAHTIYTQALGDDHPLTALALDRLALMHEHEGSLDAAHSCTRSALTIYERTFGADHPFVRSFLQQLARIARELGRDDEADALEHQAEQIPEPP